MKGDCKLPDGREVEYEVHLHSDCAEIMSCCLLGSDEQIELTEAEEDCVIQHAYTLSDAMLDDYYDDLIGRGLTTA